jgi:hypothetical protein
MLMSLSLGRMPPGQFPCFGVSNERLLSYVSRAAYCLWAGPSDEVHVIPVHRCSKTWLASDDARGIIEVMPQKISSAITGRLTSWVGPLDWTIKTPGVLPLVENNVFPLEAALRCPAKKFAKRRRVKRLKVYGMNQLEWEQGWLAAVCYLPNEHPCVACAQCKL